MIPFSILSIYLTTEYGNRLELRALELSPSFFSFRVPKGWFKKNGKAILFELFFYIYEEKAFKAVRLEDSSFDTEMSEVKEFYEVYRVETKDKEYTALSTILTKEYLTYIDNKLTLDGPTLSAVMTKSPAYEEWKFCKDLSEQKDCFSEKVRKAYDGKSWNCLLSQGINIYISLENDKLYNDFLGKSFDRFVKDYYEDAGLEFHALCQHEVSGLYLGNPFCNELLPDKELLRKIVNKAMGLNLELTFVLAPVSEEKCETIEEYIDFVDSLVTDSRWQAQDRGYYDYLIEKHETEAGPLIIKACRDPRNRYINVCEDNISMSETSLYLPFYQTNTATFCTLHALVKSGNRGKNRRVYACDKECMSHCLIYPKHLDMLGKYNSLMGYNVMAMGSGLVMKDELCKLKRLVINL